MVRSPKPRVIKTDKNEHYDRRGKREKKVRRDVQAENAERDESEFLHGASSRRMEWTTRRNKRGKINQFIQEFV